jgi:hypothetical protein
MYWTENASGVLAALWMAVRSGPLSTRPRAGFASRGNARRRIPHHHGPLHGEDSSGARRSSIIA